MPTKKQSKSAFDSMVKPDWPAIWQKIGTRKAHIAECDDGESLLYVVASCDGDLHITLERGRKQLNCHPSFRARTSGGGGHKEKVRIALAMLALAITEDCQEIVEAKDAGGH